MVPRLLPARWARASAASDPRVGLRCPALPPGWARSAFRASAHALPAPAPGDRERFIDFGYANSDWAVAHFPAVVLNFDSDGTGLSLAVIQTFDRPDGTAYSRSLGTRWSLRTEDLIDTACRIVDRNLTEQEWAEYVGEGVPYRSTCSAA